MCVCCGGKKFWFTDIDNDVILVKVISPQKSGAELVYLNYLPPL